MHSPSSRIGMGSLGSQATHHALPSSILATSPVSDEAALALGMPQCCALCGSHALGTTPTLCRSMLQGPSCLRSRDHTASSSLPNQQEEGRRAGAPGESHSDNNTPGVPAGPVMMQMRPRPRDGTRGPKRQLVRSWLICTPDTFVPHTPPSSYTLSLNADSSEANRQSFRLKVSSSTVTRQQTLQDSTPVGALESATQGLKWISVPGAVRGGGE